MANKFYFLLPSDEINISKTTDEGLSNTGIDLVIQPVKI